MRRSNIEFIVPQIKAMFDNDIKAQKEELFTQFEENAQEEYKVFIVEEDGSLLSAVECGIREQGGIAWRCIVRFDYYTTKQPTIAQLVKIQQVLKEYFTPDGYVEPPKHLPS